MASFTIIGRDCTESCHSGHFQVELFSFLSVAGTKLSQEVSSTTRWSEMAGMEAFRRTFDMLTVSTRF